MAQAVPHKLNLEENPLPLPGRFKRTKFPSTEGTTHNGRQSHILLPNGRNMYLNCKNSWLNFTVQCTITGTNLPTAVIPSNPDTGTITYTNEDALAVDPMGLVSCIQRITVTNNKLPIFVLNDYNKVHAMLCVAQGHASSQGVRALTGGATFGGAFIPDNLAPPLANNLEPTRLIKGFGNGEVLTSTGTKFVGPRMGASIPLLGLLGNAQIPLAELKGEVEIIIDWVEDGRNLILTAPNTTTDAIAVTGMDVTVTAVDFAVTDVSYDGAVTILDDASQLAVQAENRSRTEPIMWSDKYYYAFGKNIGPVDLGVATTVKRNDIISSTRVTSLCAMYLAGFATPKVNPTGVTTVANKNWESFNVPHIFYDKIRYRIGGIEHPKQLVDSVPQMVQNTVACSSNNDPSIVTGLMKHPLTTNNWKPEQTAWSTGTNSAPASLSTAYRFVNRGLCGINFEAFPDMYSISGLDASSVDTECEYEIIGNNTATYAQSIRAIWLAVYDVVYVIEDGQIRKAK